MNFDDLIGNNSVKENLKKAISNSNLSNTMLFSGPDGIGKSLFAIELAAHLMHPETDIDPEALKKIKSNNHPDLHILEPEGKTSTHSISSIKNLIDEVFMAPFEAAAKVFIIKDASRMLKASANALLKTLEEPTLDSYIILISNRVEDIIPTIVSRCFRINFSSIEQKEIVSFLEKKFSFSEIDAIKLAKISAGSIGKASQLANHPDYLKKRDLLINILAKENITSYYELSDAISNLEETYTDSFSKDSLVTLQKEVDLLIEKIFYWFRDLHLLKMKGDEKYLFFSDKIDLLKKQNLEHLFPLDKLNILIDEIHESISRNIKLKYVLENFFLKINFI
jgi:DNA polymerase-3 subunit delta'